MDGLLFFAFSLARSLFGFLLLAACFFLVGALLSFSSYDPSLNVSIDATAYNWMGSLGAVVSDLAFQWLGLGASVLPLMALWGFFRCIQPHPLIGRFSTLFAILLAIALLQNLCLPSLFYQSAVLQALKEIAYAQNQKPLFLLCAWTITVLSLFYSVWRLGLIRLLKLFVAPLPSKKRKAYTKPAALSISTDPVVTLKETFSLPPLELLCDHAMQKTERLSKKDYEEQKARLQEVLEEFGIKGNIVRTNPGPIVTLYELEPAAGVKSARVIGLADDIARSMSALSARVALIPGKNVIGIELSNTSRETVYLRELLASSDYNGFQGGLPMALGKDIAGYPVIADLTKMPHLLVAGTTGSGKSVGINSMILSLLYQLSPEECRLIMIDPKMLELSIYDGIPHLLTPVVTEPKKAILILKWVVKEMEQRYRMLSQLGVRNISGYNQRVAEALNKKENLTRRVQTGFDENDRPIFEEQPLDLKKLPFIVVVVDEMADLMLVAGKDLEIVVQRLAQMARASGIHLIMATQRPSVDVITGTIKANFPTRISFQVTSKIDSRTILGEQGAEQLLGQGDMLYMATGGRIMRVHGPYVSDAEIDGIAGFLRSHSAPDYIDLVLDEEEDSAYLSSADGNKGDPVYQQAIAIVRRDQRISTSYLQRQLQIGYNRAARIVEQMENEGLISAPNAVGKREIL
jgi:S-DNA-T family DNA segregation ATPase FtsK/SpoIIIE